MTSSTTSMGGTSRTLSNHYDADGNRTRVTYPDGNYTEYFRDGLGRIHYTSVNGTTPVFHPQYDATGRPSNLYRLRHSDWTWGMPTVNGYDGISRLTSRYHSFTSATYNVLQGFGYNPASQITSRTRDNNAYAFTGYVGVNRSYSTNGLNQYASAGGVSFGYDSNGNLTASGTTAYTYDAENRLVAASTGANLVYDPLGRLYQTSGGSAGTTQFLYDGDELVMEYAGTGSVLRRYVHGSDADDPLVWYEGAVPDTPRSLYSDHQGSIVAVTDHLGNVLHVNSYDEYGIPGSANAGRFQYTGQAWIPELGMHHYKARIYSPTLGRFLQTDPIGYDDQVNLYAYVANDPVNGRDPAGTFGLFGGCPAGSSCTSTNPDASNAAVGMSSSNARASTTERTAGAKPETPTYRISIIVDTGKGSESSSGGSGSGHAWIRLERVENGRVVAATTRGLWKDGYAQDNGPGRDIRVNMEMNRRGYASRSAMISEDMANRVLNDANRDVTYNEISNNCTDYAAHAWRMATGQKLRTSSWATFGISMPGELANTIGR